MLVLAACGAEKGSNGSASSGCPATWRAGWQKLADRIHAPVYCPSWMPQPLDARIGAAASGGPYVERDRRYLASFIYSDPHPTAPYEVHVNLRGYPGRTSIPVCEDTVTAQGKTVHTKIPCFAD